MRPFQFGKKQKLIWALFLAAAWGTVIYIFLQHDGGLTVKELLRYKPANPFLSCLAMLGLFALKSVDFLINSGLLFAADGIMFPLPMALLLNVLGIVDMVTPTYFLGRFWGQSVLEHLHARYPKLRVFDQRADGGSLAVAILLRSVGLPIQAGSLYMGAAGYGFGRFLLGSILGLLPAMVPFTVMGESAGNAGSPAFLIAVGFEVLACLSSALVWALMSKRQAAKAEQNAQS